MTYVKPRRFVRKRKDILALALKGLWPGQELLCTPRTYAAIEQRLEAFLAVQQDKRLATIRYGELRKIRRVA